MPEKKLRDYKGEKISVHYEVARCMHAAECVKSGLKKVFDNTKRPWVEPDAAEPERIIDVVERCPSGALSYTRHDVASQELSESNSLRPQPNSALYLRGALSLQDSNGATLRQAPRLALCRCGQSKNKPFCDYSHHEAGFNDEGKLGNSNLKTDVIDTETALHVKTTPNGPLLITGSFALRSADNSSIVYGEKTALCRCGQSNNKPFCDGSHVKADFKAE